MLKKISIISISLVLIMSLPAMDQDSTDDNSNSLQEEQSGETSKAQASSVMGYTLAGGRFGDDLQDNVAIKKPFRKGINPASGTKPLQIMSYQNSFLFLPFLRVEDLEIRSFAHRNIKQMEHIGAHEKEEVFVHLKTQPQKD